MSGEHRRQHNAGGEGSPLLHSGDEELRYGSHGHRHGTRRRSTVPGLTNAEFAKRSRYCQFYNKSKLTDFLETDIGGHQSQREILEGINYHYEMLNSLPEQPWPMKQKLQAARQAREYLKWQLARLGVLNRVTHERKRAVKRVNTKANDKISSFHIWMGLIKKIEAYFGSGVASYFVFLRTLLWMNLVMGILVFAFICIPQIVVGDYTKLNFTTGLGFLQDTIVFYGAYDSRHSIGDGYMLPLAYFLTAIVVYLYCFLSIIRRMMVKYKKAKMDGTNQDYPFSWDLFCGWDHTVTKKEGVQEKVKAITTDFKEKTREITEAQKHAEMKMGFVYSMRFLVNIIVVILLVASGVLIVYVDQLEARTLPVDVPSDFSQLWDEYKLSVVVAGLKLIVPIIFDQLVKLEKWHPRTEIKWTLGRTTLFYYASLAVLILSLYRDRNVDCGSDIPNSNGTDVACEAAVNCWESQIGEEIFKVVLLDIGASILAVLGTDGIRAWFVSGCRLEKKVGYGEFAVATSVLELIYGQALVWLGVYFSPLLPLVAVVKLVILFYFRYVLARVTNRPPQQMFRASRSGNFYLALLLFTLCLCLFPVAYAVIIFAPSTNCGPFETVDRVYEIFTNEIGTLPTWLQDVLDFIVSPAVVVPFIIILCLIILYFRAQASSYRVLAGDLRMQLHFERSEGKRSVYAVAKRREGRQATKDAARSEIPEELID